MRGRLWPGLCARWRLSTALFRGMPDRFPFSVPGGLFVRRPSFPFRFRPSFPGLPFRIVISLVFSQPVGAPSFPCLPGFHLNIYEVFSCVASCASSVLSLCVPSVPVSSPFCNPCSPLHFSVPIRSVAPVRLPCFPCVRLLSSSIHLSLPPPVPPPFLRPLPFSFLSFLCVRLLTHALYFPCVPFVPVLLPLCRPFCPSFSVLGLSVPLVLFLCFLCACFQPRCPHLPGAIPPFSPPPFPPLPPSFPRFPSPILRSFPLLRFPLRKKFPLKSCMISSVKYMFYSIFLVYMRKFF